MGTSYRLFLTAQGRFLPDLGEAHGLSVFLKNGRDVFHTYSTYARGVEHLVDVNSLLEATPFGREHDWEDSPKGWPQIPTYG